MIVLISNQGKTSRVRTYTRKNGYVEVQRSVLSSRGKLQGFEPSEYWQYAKVPNGDLQPVKGVGDIVVGGFEW